MTGAPVREELREERAATDGERERALVGGRARPKVALHCRASEPDRPAIVAPGRSWRRRSNGYGNRSRRPGT
ncbi:MAG: hypothetical protein JWO62_2954 [Acidimicrobiaceae bacterium]|nr:hypothetical protein [Acidimicrobiaceae bacterium]